ncbi:unnamed protein product, partial [Staurois parvus]
YTWHNAVRQVPFPWQQPNPDTSNGLPDREEQFITLEKHISTALESSGGMLYTTVFDTLQ